MHELHREHIMHAVCHGHTVVRRELKGNRPAFAVFRNGNCNGVDGMIDLAGYRMAVFLESTCNIQFFVKHIKRIRNGFFA